MTKVDFKVKLGDVGCRYNGGDCLIQNQEFLGCLQNEDKMVNFRCSGGDFGFADEFGLCCRQHQRG